MSRKINRFANSFIKNMYSGFNINKICIRQLTIFTIIGIMKSININTSDYKFVTIEDYEAGPNMAY